MINKRRSLKAMFLVLSCAVAPALAQSWGQFKDAALTGEAEKNYSAALDFWQKALDVSEPGGPRYLPCLFGLARCYAQLGDAAKAEAAYKKLAELVPSSGPLSEESRGALVSYADFLRKEKRDADADNLEAKFSLKAQAESASTATTLGGASASASAAAIPEPNLRNQFPLLIKTGTAQLNAKQYGAAEKSFKEALLLAENLKDKSLIAMTLAKLVLPYAAQAKNKEGEACSARLVALMRETKGSNSQEFGHALAAHAVWLRRLNRRPEAMAEEAKVERILWRPVPMQDSADGGAIEAVSSGADTSGTKHGSIYSRARSAQTGYTDRLNGLLQE